MDVDDSLYARLFACAPVCDQVFPRLSPRSLIRLGMTCRVIYAAVANFKSRAFNINRHLSRYFTNPITFRSLQAKTNSLVSGSNALQFLDRTFYSESDLDLYTHPGHSFEVAQFLVEVEGYTYAPSSTQEPDWKVAIGDQWDGTRTRVIMGSDGPYPLKGISGVWSFKKTNIKGENLTVQIIEAASSPVEAILGFHSTIVMNFISSDAAYSLYPVWTFEERCALGMHPALRSSPTAIQKYVQRGWRVYFEPTPYDLANPMKPPFLLDQTRWVGDRYTWVLPLDQTGIKPRPTLSTASAPLTVDPVLCNGWKLRRENGAHGSWVGYECFAYPIQSTMFRYNYAIPDEALMVAIRRWAHCQGKYSHEQISKEDWVWFDADIPRFLLAESDAIYSWYTRTLR